MVIAVAAAVACCSTRAGTQEPPTLEVFVPALATPTHQVPTQVGATAAPIACADDARFIEDLTIPDGTHMDPGERIDKRWSVQNTGTCDWGPDYRLVRISGDALVGPDEIALYPARAGTDAVWQVVLDAPDFPGEYSSRWQAQAPDGTRFGDDVFVLIEVTP
jgi:hypothetical protein